MDFVPGKDKVGVSTGAESTDEPKIVQRDNGLHVIDDDDRLILGGVEIAGISGGDFLF